MPDQMRCGDVVKSKIVMVDFGEITVSPGDYGLVCPNQAAEDLVFPLVHWRDGYTCSVARSDVEVVPEESVGRIVGGPACGYCSRRKAKK